MTNVRLKPSLVTARAIHSRAVASFRWRKVRDWNAIGATTITRPSAMTSIPKRPQAAPGSGPGWSR